LFLVFAMDMGMGGESSNGFVPLNDFGVDFKNETQAFTFLQEILDDSYLQVDANRYARYFWYGIVVVVFLAAITNRLWTSLLQSRLVAVVPYA
jgi:ferric-chelate reductase